MAQMLQKPVFALPGCQRMSVDTLFVILWGWLKIQGWAELKGGAKRTEKQNLAKMARRKPFFETLRKRFLRRSAEGNSGNF